MNTTPSKYRKKPVTIEAVALTRKNVREVAAWCGGRVIEEGKPSDPSDIYLGLDIPTLEGVMRAETLDPSGRYPHGDWIIKGVNGEFYIRKPHIFAATYEENTMTKVADETLTDLAAERDAYREENTCLREDRARAEIDLTDMVERMEALADQYDAEAEELYDFSGGMSDEAECLEATATRIRAALNREST